MYMENQTTKPSVSERNEHMDLKRHHIRQLTNKRAIEFQQTRGANQLTAGGYAH